MIIVPVDTPGVDIIRDVATMEDPETRVRPVRQPRRDRATWTCGFRSGTWSGREGSGFVLAQKRLGPGRIHHCMRWLGQSRRAFDMLCERSVSRYAHGSTLAEKQTIQNWIADSMAEMRRPG